MSNVFVNRELVLAFQAIKQRDYIPLAVSMTSKLKEVWHLLGASGPLAKCNFFRYKEKSGLSTPLLNMYTFLTLSRILCTYVHHFHKPSTQACSSKSSDSNGKLRRALLKDCLHSKSLLIGTTVNLKGLYQQNKGHICSQGKVQLLNRSRLGTHIPVQTWH